jgi:nucleoside-diphosphate-sugar epimerase
MTRSGAVVVTGAAGFIGTPLTRALAHRGEEVRAVDVAADPYRFRLGVRYSRADVCDTAALRPLLKGADTVYHLASAELKSDGRAPRCREVNVAAVERLVQASAESGVRRIVHASTAEIGHLSELPARENALVAPMTPYEQTRLEGEQAVGGVAQAAGIEFIILRLAWVYGPGSPSTSMLLRSVRGGHFVYIGEGRNLRHPVYLTDAVDAFLLAGRAPGSATGRTYTIAGPRYVTLRELVETCARVFDVPPPRVRLPREVALALGRAAELAWAAARREPPFSRRSLRFFEDDQAYDTTAARQNLGFEPKVDLEEGLRLAAQTEIRLIGT